MDSSVALTWCQRGGSGSWLSSRSILDSLKLVVSGAALALGTFLVLTGVVALGILTNLGGGPLLVGAALYVALPWAIGSLLLVVGWQAWCRARSN